MEIIQKSYDMNPREEEEYLVEKAFIEKGIKEGWGKIESDGKIFRYSEAYPTTEIKLTDCDKPYCSQLMEYRNEEHRFPIMWCKLRY